MSLVPHHPEARFAEPGSLVKHYKDVYRRLYGTPKRAKTVIPRKRDVLHIATEAFDGGVKDILREIGRAHGFTVDELRGERRDAKIVKARHAAIVAVARARPMWSLPQIGRFFRRDHTTILYVLRKARVRP